MPFHADLLMPQPPRAPNQHILRDHNGPYSSWFLPSNGITRILGFSFIASLLRRLLGGHFGNDAGGSLYFMDSIMLFLLGSMIEGGRRLFAWAMDRFKLFQFSINAQFIEGDPVYEWLLNFMTQERIWKRSRQFRVQATSSIRQWTVNLEGKQIDGHMDEYAEYVPTYDDAQLFRWNGYWMEIRRNSRTYDKRGRQGSPPANMMDSSLFLTIYTRDMSVLSTLVREARRQYVEINRPHVIVHSIDQETYPGSIWSTVKSKARRPLNSIILQEGVIDSLTNDVRRFIKSERWYTSTGVPHRRGYLLYGPPGTGKSSTIYAIAGELGLEIYCLSLAASFVSDSFLARAVSSMPKHSILLIEDIDCAFPSREDDDQDFALSAASAFPFNQPPGPPLFTPYGPLNSRSTVTLSGLLNVLDGVGSEEGRIFFATTNYIDKLDPALLRPGRIDRKVEYKLATQSQAAALFLRFYPVEYTTLEDRPILNNEKEKLFDDEQTAAILCDLSEKFARSVPDHEFSTAELQGYLLSCFEEPEKAVAGIEAWIEQERTDKEERKKREDKRAKNQQKKKASVELKLAEGSMS